MPYQVIAIRNGQKFTSYVPQNELAYCLLRHLKALNFNLVEIQNILLQTDYGSNLRLLNESEYFALTNERQALDYIYSCITLKNHEKLYFHTNWMLPKESWEKLATTLLNLNISVTTLETAPTPEKHIIEDLVD